MFCTAINCMDGRTQLPVNTLLKKRFNAEYVDTITEPGPNKILAENNPQALVDSIITRLDISVNKHASVGIGIVAHHDCAGNPCPKEEQLEQIKKAVRFIKSKYQTIEVIGIWVDDKWKAVEV